MYFDSVVEAWHIAHQLQYFGVRLGDMQITFPNSSAVAYFQLKNHRGRINRAVLHQHFVVHYYSQ